MPNYGQSRMLPIPMNSSESEDVDMKAASDGKDAKQEGKRSHKPDDPDEEPGDPPAPAPAGGPAVQTLICALKACTNRDRIGPAGICSECLEQGAAQCIRCFGIFKSAIDPERDQICDDCKKRRLMNDHICCSVSRCRQSVRNGDVLRRCDRKHRNAGQCEICWRVYKEAVAFRYALGVDSCRGCVNRIRKADKLRNPELVAIGEYLADVNKKKIDSDRHRKGELYGNYETESDSGASSSDDEELDSEVDDGEGDEQDPEAQAEDEEEWEVAEGNYLQLEAEGNESE